MRMKKTLFLFGLFSIAGAMEEQVVQPDRPDKDMILRRFNSLTIHELRDPIMEKLMETACKYSFVHGHTFSCVSLYGANHFVTLEILKQGKRQIINHLNELTMEKNFLTHIDTIKTLVDDQYEEKTTGSFPKMVIRGNFPEGYQARSIRRLYALCEHFKELVQCEPQRNLFESREVCEYLLTKIHYEYLSKDHKALCEKFICAPGTEPKEFIDWWAA